VFEEFEQSVAKGPDEVWYFWFEALSSKQWWQKDEALDQLITLRFTELYRQARSGELYSWRESVRGRLSEIILLDQFSRNMFRDQPQAFAQDAQCLTLAQEAIRVGADQAVTEVQRPFFYLPFMHSESMVIQDVSVQLYEQLVADSDGRQNNVDFALRHRVIIERFGRFPHRNTQLGRASTDAEVEFLKRPGSSF